MRKILFVFAVIIMTGLLSAQWNPFAMFDQGARNGITDRGNKIERIIEQSDRYWKTHDRFAPHSGIKPYERWKYQWKPYIRIGADPVSAGWELWRQRTQQNRPQTDDSDWYLVGDPHYIRHISMADKGRVNAVLIDPTDSNIIYVGAPAGGLWKSTDGGHNWTPLTDFLPSIGVSAIALDPTDHNTVYIGTGDDDARVTSSSGVWKSTDGGITWSNITPGLSSGLDYISGIEVDPANSQHIVIGTSSGVYVTADGGTNWSHPLTAEIREIRMHPSDGNYIYAVSRGTFYRSTDGGNSFSAIRSGLPNSASVLVLDVTPAAPNNVYVIGVNASSGFLGLFVSTNRGNSFIQTGETDNIIESRQWWYDLAMAVSDTDPNKIFMGELNIWRSTDGGNNFLRINNWSIADSRFTHADIHFMRYYNGKLAVGSDGGIYISEDDGNSFTGHNNNLAISQVYRVSVSPEVTSEFIYGGLQDNGGIAEYQNRWTIYHGADGMDNAIDLHNKFKAFSFIYYGYGLYVTFDGGGSISQAIQGPEIGNWVTPLQMSPANELYAGYRKLYKLDQNAWSWQSVTGSSFNSAVDVFEFNPSNANEIYLGEGSDLYKSIDGGVNFTLIHSFYQDISSIAIDPENGRIWVATENHVYESSDGSTFTDISGGIPSSVAIRDLVYHRFSPDSRLYVGTDIGVYRRIGNGQFELFSNHLPVVPVYDLELSLEAGTLTAATFGRSVWQTTVPVYSPDYDLKVAGVRDFQGRFVCSPVSQLDFLVKNNGQNAIGSFNYQWNINGNGGSQTWSGNLNPGDETVISIPLSTSINLGKINVDFSVELSNDRLQANNVYTGYFLVNKSDSVFFSYDFEHSSQDLLTVSTNNDTSVWSLAQPSGSVLNTASSGSRAYVTMASGNYRNADMDYLYLPCLDFSRVLTADISFDLAFDIETEWDALYMEYSTDGIHWQILGSAADSAWYNNAVVNGVCRGAQWTGTRSTMQTYRHSLDFLAGEPQVYLRFVMASDESVTEEGAVIDDLEISGQMGVEHWVNASALRLYPNPAGASLNLKNETGYPVQQLSIYNASGQMMRTQTLPLNATDFSVDVSGLSPGFYFIKIIIRDQIISLPFVKK